MKIILGLLFITGCAYAQTPTSLIRRDSVPDRFPPDLMPTVRSSNSFYRYRSDPKNVMRATLDNMPVKGPDSSVDYSTLRSAERYRMPLPEPFKRPFVPQPSVPRKP